MEEKLGGENVIWGVMEGDEMNVGGREEVGKEVQEYDVEGMVVGVVEKEMLWSKGWKEGEVGGRVKGVVNEIRD